MLRSLVGSEMCIRDRFKCYNEECGREFELKIIHVSLSNMWCPCCNGSIFCSKKECVPCYNKSFASFKDKDKVNAWSSKNHMNPYEVSIFSSEEVIFKCYKCTYEFKTRIADISKKGTWCPCCHAIKNKFIKKFIEIFNDDMDIEYKVEIPVSYTHLTLPTTPYV